MKLHLGLNIFLYHLKIYFLGQMKIYFLGQMKIHFLGQRKKNTFLTSFYLNQTSFISVFLQFESNFDRFLQKCCFNKKPSIGNRLLENYVFHCRDQSTHMSLLSHMSFGCERVICGRHYPVQDRLNPCCSFETRLPTLLIIDF